MDIDRQFPQDADEYNRRFEHAVTNRAAAIRKYDKAEAKALLAQERLTQARRVLQRSEQTLAALIIPPNSTPRYFVETMMSPTEADGSHHHGPRA